MYQNLLSNQNGYSFGKLKYFRMPQQGEEDDGPEPEYEQENEQEAEGGR